MTDGSKQRLGLGGAFALIAMVLILVASLWFAYWGWNLTDAVVSSTGMTALVLGVVASLLLGGGLMALVFWSHRKGYDR